MGLQVQQEMARIQAEVVSVCNQTLEKATGKPIEWDVDWSLIQSDKAVKRLEETLTEMTKSVTSAAGTKARKEAIGDSFVRIVLKNIENPLQKKIYMEHGALHILTVLDAADESDQITAKDLRSFLQEVF